MSAVIRRAEGFEDNPLVLMDYCKNLAGAAVTQASLSALTYRVDEYASQEDAEQCESGTETVDDTALTISSCIYDTLQTAAPWDAVANATGYNLRFTLPGTARPNGNKWHRVEVNGTASGVTFAMAVWIVETKAMGGT